MIIQEELFDILWNDTQACIRAEGVHELTVNKHLKDAQQLTFLQCTHYDHAFQEFATDDKKRFEELYVDLLKRLTLCHVGEYPVVPRHNPPRDDRSPEEDGDFVVG